MDLDTCLAVKDFTYNKSLRIINNFDFIKNKDFRYLFGLRYLEFLDVNIDNIESYNYILINSNLRFESPIINLKLKKIFSNHENNIFVVGFISNFNFDFKHLDISISKFFLNFIIQNEKNIILSSNQVNYFQKFNLISHNISLMTKNDLNCVFINNFKNSNYLRLNIGYPENYFYYYSSFFNIDILHHVDDNFTKNFDFVYSVLLPSSFYFEKTTTFINNSFNFFNMLTHFSLKLPNTKPE